ncbi:MAG: hypothetical protein ABSA93_17000 [Streptosporangiaceae bacterium]|jgi:hypothetical protein
MVDSFIGVDVAGVQGWQSQLNAAHENVITALNHYKTTAQQNAEVAHGSHFDSLNSQCESITSTHLSDHDNLHTQYTQASNKLVTGVLDVAGS